MYYASDELKNNKDFVLQAIKIYGLCFEYVSDKLKNDKVVALKAIEENSSNIKYISNELKRDKEIILKAVEKDADNIKYVSDELKKDEEFMKQLKKINNSIIIDDLILEYKFVYKENFFDMNESYGLIGLLKDCGISILEKDKYDIEIIIKGKLSKKICNDLNVEYEQNNDENDEDYTSFTQKYSSKEEIEETFNILDSNKKRYYIYSLKLYIGFTTYNSLKEFDRLYVK